MGALRRLLSHFGTWYILGYAVLVLAIAFVFYLQSHDRQRGRDALCDALTTYTRALGAGREFTREDAGPFLDTLNRDLEPLGCEITFEEISHRP